MIDVIVIGGGASGLAAAITAARRGRRVCVYEATDRVGKKILASGNGKCNLAARLGTEYAYNTGDVSRVFARVSESDVEAFFASTGLALRADAQGRVYPYSELASSVLGVLRAELDRLGVEVRTNTPVAEIVRDGEFWRVGAELCRKVVLATGSPATFGRDSTGLAERLGLSVRPFVPSLVPLLTDTLPIKGLKGVRFKVAMTLYRGSCDIARTRGELLVKDNGLSGIAAFDLSCEIARGGGGSYTVSVDFPDYTAEELTDILREFGFAGLCHKELARNVADRARDESAQARLLKDYRIRVKGVSSVTLAQVMAGGVATEELTDECESRRCRGLYVVGETADVDGRCGGYNLLWAWASGIAAGRSV